MDLGRGGSKKAPAAPEHSWREKKESAKHSRNEQERSRRKTRVGAIRVETSNFEDFGRLLNCLFHFLTHL